MLALAVLVPVVAIVALFAAGLIRTGGRPGGIGVNETLGESTVKAGPAPELRVQLLDGRPLALSDLRGKLVMVDFWSTWCPPCEREAPGLQQVYEEYRGKGVEFVGVAIWDDRDDVAKFAGRVKTAYLMALDDRGKAAVEYGVRGIPEKYFIGPDGALVRKFIGPMTPADLRGVLDELMAAT